MRTIMVLLAVLGMLVAYSQPKAKTAGPVITWIKPQMAQSNATINPNQVEICIQSKTKLTGVKLYLNNTLIESKLIDTVPEVVVKKPGSCSKYIKKALTLTAGINQIKLVAANDSGTTTSTYTVQYSPAKNTSTSDIRPEKRKALVIGNARYVDQAFIPNCYNDADSMEKVLRNLHFTVVKRKDLTMATFLLAIDSFCTDIDQYDVALLYYSGHGFEVNGFNCMFPIDARAGNIDELLNQYSLTPDPNSPVFRRFAKSGVKKCLFILDACRDNPLYASMSEEDNKKKLKKIVFGKDMITTDSSNQLIENNRNIGTNTIGCMIAYATSAATTAESVSRNNGKNSPYTAALIKNLKRQGIFLKDMLIDVQRTLKKTSMQGQNCSFYYDMRDELIMNEADSSMYAPKNNRLVNYTDKREKYYCGVFRSVVVDMEAMRDSVAGLQFHVDFEVTGMGGDGRVQIELYDEEGLPLKEVDPNVRITWSDGNIQVQSEFASNSFTYSNNDLSRDLFIPYASIDSKLKGKAINYIITAIANDYIKLKSKLRRIDLPVWK
jgi:hypothetical protein